MKVERILKYANGQTLLLLLVIFGLFSAMLIFKLVDGPMQRHQGKLEAVSMLPFYRDSVLAIQLDDTEEAFLVPLAYRDQYPDIKAKLEPKKRCTVLTGLMPSDKGYLLMMGEIRQAGKSIFLPRDRIRRNWLEIGLLMAVEFMLSALICCVIFIWLMT